jgi:hypothetical protein
MTVFLTDGWEDLIMAIPTDSGRVKHLAESLATCPDATSAMPYSETARQPHVH